MLAGIESTLEFVMGALYAITGNIMIGISLYSLPPAALRVERLLQQVLVGLALCLQASSPPWRS